jgi:CO/xanthine dehydrogenase FAD-binding subunit
MKPAPFDYRAPATLREAISLLGSNPEAAVIAGGQSLMPVLAFRLAMPNLLIDLRRIPELGYVNIGEDGVRLGALVRWRDIEDDRRLPTEHPLLCEAVGHVAHYQIRNRGTIGGSLAHADPAAELPGIAVTCEAEITLVGPDGSRTLLANEFFTGPLSTLRRADEIIVELHLEPTSEPIPWGSCSSVSAKPVPTTTGRHVVLMSDRSAPIKYGNRLAPRTLLRSIYSPTKRRVMSCARSSARCGDTVRIPTFAAAPSS